MKRLQDIISKPEKLVIGLMSGTSADGVDAALLRVCGHGRDTRAHEIAFVSKPFDDGVRARILALAGGDIGGSRELCFMGALLGKLYASACHDLIKEAGVDANDIDLIGSHGQTLWHAPGAENYLGYEVAGTLQIGEASILCEAFGCPAVSDFRVRDVAAGGQGAPLVPYTEWLLYRSDDATVALQNMGGIGNITLMPKGCELKDVIAFDTGPGNMVMDALTHILTNGAKKFDEGGALAASGRVNGELLKWMLSDEYISAPPPKSTGRERYGERYVSVLLKRAELCGASLLDCLATSARFTAECVREGVERFCSPRPQRLMVSGGGAHNKTLMRYLAEALPGARVTANPLADHKEAAAFAILANECVHSVCSNIPAVTGAARPEVLGKISQ